MTPKARERARLLLWAHDQGERCAAHSIIDAEDEHHYCQFRGRYWHLWLARDGRFLEVMICDRLAMIQKAYPSVTILQNGYACALPVPAPAEGRGRYKRH